MGASEEIAKNVVRTPSACQLHESRDRIDQACRHLTLTGCPPNRAGFPADDYFPVDSSPMGSVSTNPRHRCSIAGRFADNAAPHEMTGVASCCPDRAHTRCTVTDTPIDGTRTLNC